MQIQLLLCLIVSLALFACETNEHGTNQKLFTKVDSLHSGVYFSNQLAFSQEFNIYTYRNFFNGGGVGLGDFNNDGLLDIYFTANQKPNKLYLNKGNFTFEDITDRAGVAGTKAWSTGVSLADVNGDGWLDIYVCNSGDVKGDDKENELFINNGDLTFTEAAKAYGIADKGFTTHAVFFDYDRDGDLDLYILNNSYQAIGSFNLMKNERPKRDPLGGDKLMRNDGGRFVDVSEQAGIYGSIIGFGLGATVGDVNRDGWPDIYVSNDFFERDYLYLNNKDGTFRECLTEQMTSISGASMGADMADINNDGYPDIFVTEMLPRSNERIKTVTTFENWDRYQYGVKNDYYHQFTRNTLQLNNGNGTFSEISRLAGVEATDWSWGALIFDADLDGWKDVFVANGIYKDLTNQDYLQYVSNEEFVRSVVAGNTVDYKRLVDLIPSNPVPDFIFQNQGGLTFIDKSSEWGLDEPNFSSGSAYGDIDNDGDLDLVVNHVNATASIYRNDVNLVYPSNRFISFRISGDAQNSQGIGTVIKLVLGDEIVQQEQVPNRGFESSVDPRLVFGVGAKDTIERVEIFWPDGQFSELKNVATNQHLQLDYRKMPKKPLKATGDTITWFQKLELASISFRHQENEFVDFDRDKLVYHMLSTEGPHAAVGDVNGDGLDDVFIGGAKGQSGSLWLQDSKGQFSRGNTESFEEDRESEDVDCAFLDADGDRDLDLYVCSGGSEFSSAANALMDRLYLNDGRGNFSKTKPSLPAAKLESSSVVKSADFDNDGDLDLFVGIRSRAFGYGLPMNGYILQNNGRGIFSDITNEVAPGLLGIGMITDAVWADVDGDGDSDLAVVGEYMSIRTFINNNGKLEPGKSTRGSENLSGWWNRIQAADLDLDGDVDFVVANHGLNSRFEASQDKPVTLFVSDFDRNGSLEHILQVFNGDEAYPMVLRHDLLAQIPSLKKKILKYEDYKGKRVPDLFDPEVLADAIKLEAYEFRSGVLLNKGDADFEFRSLPIQAQVSPAYAIAVADFDADGIPDILLGGNLFGVKPEVGRYDGSYGTLLKGNGDGGFSFIEARQSGVSISGQVRDFKLLQVDGRDVLMVIRNNDSALLYSF